MNCLKGGLTMQGRVSSLHLQSTDKYSLISRIYSNQYIDDDLNASDEHLLTASFFMHVATHIEDYCDCV